VTERHRDRATVTDIKTYRQRNRDSATDRDRDTVTETQRHDERPKKERYLIILIPSRQYNGISSLTVSAVNTSDMRTMNTGLTRLNIHTHTHIYIGIVVHGKKGTQYRTHASMT